VDKYYTINYIAATLLFKCI